MSERSHSWELVDAVQLGDENSDTLTLAWRCRTCTKRWSTVAGVTVPTDEAGACNDD